MDDGVRSGLFCVSFCVYLLLEVDDFQFFSFSLRLVKKCFASCIYCFYYYLVFFMNKFHSM